MVHKLTQMESTVNKSHPGLGKLFAFSTLCVKAQRVGVIASPKGMGKSRVMDKLRDAMPGSLNLDAATQAGMSRYQGELSGFDSLVTLDDLATVGTQYRRINTMAFLTDLSYRGYINANTGHQQMVITNFRGSILMGAQPVVLSPIMKDGMWEGTLADKSLRYWHIKRPLKPNPTPVELEIDWGLALDDIAPVDMTKPIFKPLIDLGLVQWDMPRIYEHMGKLVRASAALDGSLTVRKADVTAACNALKPMGLEEHFIDKDSLEGDRHIRTEFLLLLVEFASYGYLTKELLMRDYKVPERTAFRVLEQFKRMYTVSKKGPTIYKPAPWVTEIIESIE